MGRFAGQPPFDLVDLGGAALVGLACGVFALAFVTVITRAKQLSGSAPGWARVAVGGIMLAATVLLSSSPGSSPRWSLSWSWAGVRSRPIKPSLATVTSSGGSS